MIGYQADHLREDSPFQILVLGGRFDHQIAALELVVITGEEDILLHRLALLGTKGSRFDAFVDLSVQFLSALLKCHIIDVDDDDGGSERCENLGEVERDVWADLARTDDPDAGHRTALNLDTQIVSGHGSPSKWDQSNRDCKADAVRGHPTPDFSRRSRRGFDRIEQAWRGASGSAPGIDPADFGPFCPVHASTSFLPVEAPEVQR